MITGHSLFCETYMKNEKAKVQTHQLSTKDRDLLQQAKDHVDKCIQTIRESVIQKENKSHRLAHQQ